MLKVCQKIISSQHRLDQDYMGFCIPKFGILVGHFIKHKPLISAYTTFIQNTYIPLDFCHKPGIAKIPT